MSSVTTFAKSADRQYSVWAVRRILATDLLTAGPLTSAGDPAASGIQPQNGTTSANTLAMNIFELPAGAIVVGGQISVITAFNSATSDVVDLGDSGSATRYASALNVHTAGGVALSRSDYVLPATGGNTGNIKLKWTGVGAAPTAGEILVAVEYVLPGKSHEIQGI